MIIASSLGTVSKFFLILSNAAIVKSISPQSAQTSKIGVQGEQTLRNLCEAASGVVHGLDVLFQFTQSGVKDGAEQSGHFGGEFVCLFEVFLQDGEGGEGFLQVADLWLWSSDRHPVLALAGSAEGGNTSKSEDGRTVGKGIWGKFSEEGTWGNGGRGVYIKVFCGSGGGAGEQETWDQISINQPKFPSKTEVGSTHQVRGMPQI